MCENTNQEKSAFKIGSTYMPTRFDVRAAAPEKAAAVQRALNIPRFIAEVLVARGKSTPEEAMEFITPSLERDWLNPYTIPGMEEVVEAVDAALSEHKHIVVFGDFDLDGISATTVLTRGLRALGGHVTPFIPRRFEEGYGVTMAAYERVRKLNPALIVTVDCGIACRDEVAQIVASGMQVVVTDHHEAGASIPVGIPLADPKVSPDCESSILAGVGVALKLVQALGSKHGYPHLWRSYTDLAMLGTVADLMPMVGENRALVSDGLKRVNSDPRPCIAALIATCGCADKTITSSNLSFSLVPRLNAAGRMGDAQVALDLLMCDDYEQCFQLAHQLEEVNDQRRAIESELSEAARARAEEIYDGQRVLVVAGRGWHEGVKGIVASRLVGTYGVPTLLFTIDGDEARGSGRSVGSVNLYDALVSVSDILTRFGGHEAAVGVTLPADKLQEFAERMADYMQKLPECAFHPKLEIDAVVKLDELTLETVRALDLLAPFGQENPTPRLLARNVVLENCRAVGADKSHFSCTLTNGRTDVGGIFFHCDSIESLLENSAVVDAVFTVQIDEWRGRRNVKAMLDAIVPARACCALNACIDEIRSASSAQAGRVGAAADTTAGNGVSSGSQPASDARAKWESLAQTDPEELERAIIEAIIGNGTPHEAQRQILNRLRQGRSTLGVMATGRGKSLIFQVHAVMLALSQHKASLFVYPLRALMADQAFHMTQQFARFGLNCAVLNGECSAAERASIYRSLADGSVDILLTTPEYLMFHVDEVAACGRIGFMVVDEAHHIGQAKAGQRPAYAKLGSVVAALGAPVVLAVTATAPTDIAADISDALPVSESVVDRTSRENLHVNDQRNVKNRDDYLATLVAQGGKTVVYVNSREQSVGVARRLRMRLPQLAPMIGFYNAGIEREERKRIETLFREGVIQVLVSTSAFGEGIDIPDIRNVVLYHMPFSQVEFNQMSGRAGRDGQEAWVHLLYGRQDVSINEGILSDMTPPRDIMAQVYRHFRSLQRQTPDQFFKASLEELASLASNDMCTITPTAAKCGVDVFQELGLIEHKREFDGTTTMHSIRIVEDAGKVELTDSVRYCEGLDELDIFRSFRDWAMGATLEVLRAQVTHPIAPDQA